MLDTLPEIAYDDIVSLATAICKAPIGLISLVDTNRQWFKACIGLDATETHRDAAFCAHAILKPDDLLVIEDASLDPRFSSNPLVLGPPHIRFYAGAPIVTGEGFALGTVCVIDTAPRALDPSQRTALKALARQTAALFELRTLTLEKDEQARLLREKVIEALFDDNAAHAGFRQTQRVAAIGQLTSGVAHDFNNLLQAISVSFQLIDRKADKVEQVRRFAAQGLQSVERGARLIAQILSFSRDKSPELKPVYVSERIGDLRDLLTRVLGAEVHLHFELEAQPVPVLCDATQLEAAVLNMVVNARDAMNNAGEIRISTRLRDVTCDPELADGRYLELRITDTGPGMPYSVTTKVFDAFFTTKEPGKGTGLGLSQVRGFAMRAGGSARVESKVGKGTSFVLLLKPVEHSAGVLLENDADVPVARASQRSNILLVDDDPEVRHRLVELLEDQGYIVRPAASGSQAIQLIEQEMPEIVITDFSMRGLSGSVLARVIREINAALPVMFMTGRADMSAAETSLPPNAIMLRKPFAIGDMVNAIEGCIRRV